MLPFSTCSTSYSTIIPPTTTISSISTTSSTSPIPSCPAPGVNLIQNPGFESGSLSSWSQAGRGADNLPTTWGVESSIVHSGSYAYVVTCGNSGCGSTLTQNISGLVVGVSYNLSYYFEATTTAPSSIGCAITNGVGANNESITSTGITGWQYGPTTFGLTFTTQATSGTLNCYFGSANEGSGGA
jgi:hypothetical protein